MQENNKNKNFKIFIPGNTFPAISLSGTSCELDCAHCGGQYISQMLAVNSPDELFDLCKDLSAKGATGALLSGGCDRTGSVMLDNYINTFSKIKAELPFILNIHTGFITQEQAKKIVRTGADITSVDIVGDSGTIKDVYGLQHEPNEYKELLNTLENIGMKNIVPHICIGLDYGRVKGEFHALDLIASIKPTAIVFIVLIPTPGSKMADCAPPDIQEIIKVITYAREKYKETPIFLGCMRPRSSQYRDYNRELEKRAIDAGIDGIVLPAKETLDYLKSENFKVTKQNTCCAVQ